jgi:hypothetical protein
LSVDLSLFGGHIPGKPLRLYLTRRANGKHMFTAMPPEQTETCLSHKPEVWPKPGDEWFTELCNGAAMRMLGREIEVMESRKGRLVWIEDP